MNKNSGGNENRMISDNLDNLKIAIVQDWLVEYAGSDRVVDQIRQLFPHAVIYTLVYDKQKFPDHFQKYEVRTTYIQKIPFATRLYKSMLLLMPKAWERLDLSEYDMIISSCSSCCKGVIKRPDALHICYCHTPIRYVWDMYDEYFANAGFIKRLFMPGIIKKIKIWDYNAAQNVDVFVANSNYVADRIRRDYNRESVVIYPGSEIMGDIVPSIDDYYLFIGRLTWYKRADIAVEACSRLGKNLIVIGSGTEEKKLKKISGETVKFQGHLSDEEKKRILIHAKALIFPSEEDFGIVPVEAQSAGIPVLAYAKGGATETVIDKKTGLFFSEQNADSLIQCINKFEADGVEFSKEEILNHAKSFSEEKFKKQFLRFCECEWKEHTARNEKQ